jgi:hypothetical protein
MTEYGSRAFCLTAALTTFSTAFLMLFFLRYSCDRKRDQQTRGLSTQSAAASRAATLNDAAAAHLDLGHGERQRERARRPNGSFF